MQNLVPLQPTVKSIDVQFTQEDDYTSLITITFTVDSIVFTPSGSDTEVVVNDGNLMLSSPVGIATNSTNASEFTITGYINAKRPGTGDGGI